jgi:hypothetical protein
MKKSELKNIIKECVKEVIFEEGVLSGIISEVAQGLGRSQMSQPLNASHARSMPPAAVTEAKKEVLSAIGKQGYENVKNSFSNPELFEGTTPIPTSDGKGALSGMSPSDPGLDITSIPGFGNWGSIAKNMG